MGPIGEKLREGVSKIAQSVVHVDTESRETTLGIHLGKVDAWDQAMILWSKNPKGPQPEAPESYVHGLRGRRELIIGNRFRIPLFPVNYH